jgi:hypothetical protein
MFWSHKMLGGSSFAAELAASQEGLGSMKLATSVKSCKQNSKLCCWLAGG